MMYKEIDKKRWEPGQGPLVSEIVPSTQRNIIEVAKDRSRLLLAKGKFETDVEFSKRSATVLAPVFIVAPISTSKEANCESTFNHEKNSYQIARCLPLYAPRSIVSEHSFGEPLNLANVYDSRKINRKIWNKYYLAASLAWNDEFSVSKEQAKELDSDLMVGLVVTNPATTSACSLCNGRDVEDSMGDLAKALGSKSTILGWRDRAFKEGELLEDWDYTVTTGGMSEMMVFRKSDQRVLYHSRLVLEAQDK